MATSIYKSFKVKFVIFLVFFKYIIDFILDKKTLQLTIIIELFMAYSSLILIPKNKNKKLSKPADCFILLQSFSFLFLMEGC